MYCRACLGVRVSAYVDARVRARAFRRACIVACIVAALLRVNYFCSMATPVLCCYAPSVSRDVSLHCRFTRVVLRVAAHAMCCQAYIAVYMLPRVLGLARAAAHVLLFVCRRAVARVFSYSIGTPVLCCYALSVSRVVSPRYRFTRVVLRVSAHTSCCCACIVTRIWARTFRRACWMSPRMYCCLHVAAHATCCLACITGCTLPRVYRRACLGSYILPRVLVVASHVLAFTCCRACCQELGCTLPRVY